MKRNGKVVGGVIKAEIDGLKQRVATLECKPEKPRLKKAWGCYILSDLVRVFMSHEEAAAFRSEVGSVDIKPVLVVPLDGNA